MDKQPSGSTGKGGVKRAPMDADSLLAAEADDPVPSIPVPETGNTPAAVNNTKVDSPPQPAGGPEITATQPAPAASSQAASQHSTAGGADPGAEVTAVHPGPPAHRRDPPTGTPASKEQKISALGDFKLLKKLGAGGMGAVYKAHQISLDREAAVKVLGKHLASDASFVERFQREARIMARLDHPNILRCYGVGEEHGWHYCAMEYLDGGSMQTWLNKLGKLSVGDALCVVIACARGLQHAHEQGVIHRDVKPDNTLLTSKGVVKVADMGLAKAHGENVALTRTGTGAGTPIYMSPEQARDAKHVDHRSDIYSLGCMLYTFLAGNPPFSGETYVELFEAKEKGKFAPLRKANADVPERLGLIVDKMLDRRLEVRYQSCAELLTDLEGLGLANATPSFLQAAAEAAQATSVLPTRASVPGASPATKAPGQTTVAATQPPASRSWEAEESDIWFVSYRGHDGRLLRKRLTTAQLRDLIRDEHFDLQAQASRTLEGGYRAVASYPEFESVMRGRITKARTDRKTVKFQKMYEQLEKEEKRRQRWRWLDNLFRGAVGWVGFLIYLAIIFVVIFLIYLGIKYGFHWIATKLETMGGQ